jgi:secondary thiamine-phosphate synthase enzyme
VERSERPSSLVVPRFLFTEFLNRQDAKSAKKDFGDFFVLALWRLDGSTTRMQSIPIINEPVETSSRIEMVDVTQTIEKRVRGKKVHDGLVIVHNPHTTAAITINENADPDVQHDLLKKLATLVPKSENYYQHGEGNSDAHVKTAMVGNSVTVLIEKGKLVLGRWQGIFFCEFDGPRRRELNIKIISLDSGVV